MKHIALFFAAQLASLLSLAAADWTTTKWDAIVLPHALLKPSSTPSCATAARASYGVTGGNLSSHRPSWLNNTNLTRVDVPGLYSSIFGDGGGLICSGTINAYGACTIGGGSAINAGLYFEPPSSDWDSFFPAGWKAADMGGAINRVKARAPSTDTPSADGKQYLQSGYNIARRWIVDSLGFADVKINENKDNKHDVFGRPVYGYKNGQRAGPVPTYLQDALKLPNFHLQSGTRALSSPSITAFGPSYSNPAPADSALYLAHRSGPYASAGQTSVFFSRAAQPDGRIVG
ncbi:hypothetical protein VE04_07262, partial [Pseudogymnoascus sp. 24MN13]